MMPASRSGFQMWHGSGGRADPISERMRRHGGGRRGGQPGPDAGSPASCHAQAARRGCALLPAAPPQLCPAAAEPRSDPESGAAAVFTPACRRLTRGCTRRRVGQRPPVGSSACRRGPETQRLRRPISAGGRATLGGRGALSGCVESLARLRRLPRSQVTSRHGPRRRRCRSRQGHRDTLLHHPRRRRRRVED
jgi:hypothetical protein